MKRILIICALSLFLGSGVQANEMAIWPFSKKKAKKEQAATKDSTSRKSSVSPYQKFVSGSKKQNGLFTIHTVEGKTFFEIPASALNKDMIMSSKISESSDSQVAMAGEMQSTRLFKFTKNDDAIFLREIISPTLTIEGQDEVAKSIARNNIDPATDMFKIVHKSAKDSSFVIDVTGYMLSNAPGLGVTVSSMSMFGAKSTLNFIQPMSAVIETKAFPKNVNVKCRMVYKNGTKPFEATVTRSIVMLPEQPMKPRLADPKMNFFKTPKYQYDMNEDKGKSLAYIHRWNLAPKAEDVEAYKRGELVEPANPIIYYVDDAFPAKWKTYIKEGIEDWQIAFESIGFKNAIKAVDFPVNDPNFDPEDVRNSCFRYITVPIANAMGPSWVDPRSGEIIQGSVYLYHNVLQLVHNWMFTQTAAANPAVRARVFDEKTMGRALRYIASHEIGHTLGLMHNMKASAAYPVDSLRSATFTKKYGTTSSIMDYARFNFVAQPGDVGVEFTPPLMGEYDKFSIKIGYTPIFEGDEKEVVKGWFNEVKGKDMFVYGPQSFGAPMDPSAQSEDLGDDPVKSSRYGIKNLKFILDNLYKWSIEHGYELSDYVDAYNGVMSQYGNHLGHVSAMIGGAYLYMPDLEGDEKAYVIVSKEKQKEALNFLLNEIKELPKWAVRNDVTDKLNPSKEKISTMQANMLSMVMNAVTRIENTNIGQKNGYPVDEYLNEIYKFVWSKSGNLDRYERNLQYNYAKSLLDDLGYTSVSAAPAGSGRMFLQEFDPGVGAVSVSASSIPKGTEPLTAVEYKNIAFGQLKSILALVKSRQGSGDKSTRDHYAYLSHEISKALDK